MHRYARRVVSLSVGALGFIGVGAGVTELLAPRVWASVLLGLPVGFVVGVVLVPVTYLGLTCWDERRRIGTASHAVGYNYVRSSR